jgi:hypothetical protein
MSQAVALVTYPRFLFHFLATNRHRQLPLQELPGGRINFSFSNFLVFSLFAVLYYYLAKLKSAFCFPQTFFFYPDVSFICGKCGSQLSAFMCYDIVSSTGRIEHERVWYALLGPLVYWIPVSKSRHNLYSTLNLIKSVRTKTGSVCERIKKCTQSFGTETLT